MYLHYCRIASLQLDTFICDLGRLNVAQRHDRAIPAAGILQTVDGRAAAGRLGRPVVPAIVRR